MRVLLYADLRSPHALGWATGLREAGIEFDALSSHSAPEGSRVDRRDYAAKVARTIPASIAEKLRTLEAATRLPARRAALRAVADSRYDLIHALRLPYEGLTALDAVRNVPVVVSTWGQDFTAQAGNDAVLRRWIRRSLPLAAGLHADVAADVARASTYGLGDVPTIVAAGNFGIDTKLFHPRARTSPLVVYVRGLRPYVDHGAFLRAASALMARDPATQFAGIGLSGITSAERLQASSNGRFRTYSNLDRNAFAELIGSATVAVSPSHTDGMPNSVLEALASGCTVVAWPLPQLAELQLLNCDILFDESKSFTGLAETIENALKKATSLAPIDPMQLIPEEYHRARNVKVVREFYQEVKDRHGLEAKRHL